MKATNPYAPPEVPVQAEKGNRLRPLGVLVHLASWIAFLYVLAFIVPNVKEAMVLDFGIYPSPASLAVLWASDMVIKYWWLGIFPALIVLAASTLLTWTMADSSGAVRVLGRSIFYLPLMLLLYSAVALVAELLLGFKALE